MTSGLDRKNMFQGELRMPLLRPVTVIALATLMSCTAALPANPPATCRVTLPPARPFVPPARYPAKPRGEGSFWFGTAELWTRLKTDGTWRGLRTSSGYREKTFWWREGYYWQADPTPNLKVSGRRLDAPAQPLVAPRTTNGHREDWKSFMVVRMDFPAPGCWEITGRFEEDSLTFVVWIAP